MVFEQYSHSLRLQLFKTKYMNSTTHSLVCLCFLGSEVFLSICELFPYIFLYLFLGQFYPKWPTVEEGLQFFYRCSLEFLPTTFVLLTQ